jgi:hypothetical protein
MHFHDPCTKTFTQESTVKMEVINLVNCSMEHGVCHEIIPSLEAQFVRVACGFIDSRLSSWLMLNIQLVRRSGTMGVAISTT